MIARSLLVAAFLAWLSPAVLATDGATCARGDAFSPLAASPSESEEAEQQHEEQSLLAVQRHHRFGPLPPPREWCYKYSYSFATVTKGEGRVTNILVRYVFVDVETATVPKLDGLGVVDENFLPVSNPYNGDPQHEGVSSDQYYILFEAQNLTEANLEDRPEWTVSGLWPNAAFVSLQLQYTFPDGTTEEVSQDLLPDVAALAEPPLVGDSKGKVIRQHVVFASQFSSTRFSKHVVDESQNPFVTGNPTVLTWKGQAKCARESGRKIPGTTSAVSIAKVPNIPSSVQCVDSGTNIYRISADITAAMRLPADEKGCSKNYVFTPGIAAGQALGMPQLPVYDLKYGYIRFRMPAFQNNFEETVQRGIMNKTNLPGYDLGYFSVSSQFVKVSPELPFTVNSLMLAAQAAGSLDATEALILFAPPQVVKAMHREGDTAPPIVEIPALKRRAYVMWAPNFLFLFRYMGPSALFHGNPRKAACKKQLSDQLATPITCTEQGQFKPMVTRVDDVNSVEELIQAIPVKGKKRVARPSPPQR